jgi:predicted nucleic acid-binding Zn ribbon protein
MDEWDEEDGDEGTDEDASVDTTTCPACGASVYEGADVCPRCGEHLSDDTTGGRKRPLWIVVAALLVIAAFVLHWVFGRR